jgi:hypothetical protein
MMGIRERMFTVRMASMVAADTRRGVSVVALIREEGIEFLWENTGL